MSGSGHPGPVPADDFSQEVRPAAPRRRRPRPSPAVANRARPAPADASPAEGLARLSGEVAQLSALLARMSDDISHLDTLATVLRSDQRSVASQMGAIHESIGHVTDAVVTALGSKIEAAVGDLLGALDHELSEQYERSVLESRRITKALDRIAPRASGEAAAPLRKGLADMSRTLRKQVGEDLEKHGERHDALDATVAQLLGEVTALKRRIPLRAGDAELSPGERERLAASIARLLLEDEPARKRPVKSGRKAAGSGAKPAPTRRRPPVG